MYCSQIRPMLIAIAATVVSVSLRMNLDHLLGLDGESARCSVRRARLDLRNSHNRTAWQVPDVPQGFSTSRHGGLLGTGAVLLLCAALADLRLRPPTRSNDSKDNSRIRLSDINKPSVFQGMMREFHVFPDKMISSEVTPCEINGADSSHIVSWGGGTKTFAAVTGIVAISAINGKPGAVVHYEKGASYIDLSAIGGGRITIDKNSMIFGNVEGIKKDTSAGAT
ncbi:hypothetical protein T492DRAFT_901334, partial [Pavlovales sp. CCMP2436]